MRKIVQPSLETQELLGRLWDESQSPEEKERFLMAKDALRYIVNTGGYLDFLTYRKTLDAHAPPLVIAAFDTREEAEAWLRSHPNPPDQANVLIAGEYHTVVYAPEYEHRSMPPIPLLKFYLADLIEDGVPAPVATFNTREEAEAWLQNQPEPPQQVFVQIAGEPYVAAYHYRINLRVLYPLSLAAKP